MGAVSNPDRTTHSACILSYSCKDDTRTTINTNPWCMRSDKLSLKVSVMYMWSKIKKFSAKLHFSQTTRKDKRQHRKLITFLRAWQRPVIMSNIIIKFCIHAFHAVINFCILPIADATQKRSQHGVHCQFYTVKPLLSGQHGTRGWRKCCT